MSVDVVRSGAVTTVRIDRPDARNAIDPEHAQALHGAFVDFMSDDGARVAVLAGSAQNFCAGFDLKALAAGSAESWIRSLHFGRDGQPPVGPMGPTRLQIGKPVIAAIEGAAVAGGMELALWCDLRVMAEDAYMGVFCRRFGVPLIDGGTVRLPRIVGQGRALDLILSGRRVDARECQEIGLCNRLVEAGAARSEAERWAAQLAGMPQNCMLADRASVHAQWPDGELEALRREFLAAGHTLDEAAMHARGFAAGRGRHGESLDN